MKNKPLKLNNEIRASLFASHLQTLQSAQSNTITEKNNFFMKIFKFIKLK